MSVFTPSVGMPGVGAEKVAKHRTVAADGYLDFLPAGKIVDGTKTRDPDNPTDVTRLRAGLLLGIVTATGKLANAVLGTLQGAYTSGGTTLTVTAAQAAEIVRRVGASGTLKAIGPPSAAGTVATTSVTFSAVNTSTGDITVTSLGVNKIAGTFLTDTDGSETPRTFLPDGWEMVNPADGTDFPLDKVPVSGNVDGSNLLPWPSDTSLRAWVRSMLNDPTGFGQFVFTEQY